MKSILLLHGAIGSSQQLLPLKEALSSHYSVHLLNLPGHGGEPLPEQYSMSLFAAAVKDYIEQHSLKELTIFGYSMGGYVALYLSKHYPQAADKIITLATKFEWSSEIAAKESGMLQPDRIEQKLPTFAQTLQERHAPADWKQVLYKTAELLSSLGNQNYLHDPASISLSALIMLGDKDKMVTLTETINFYRQLPNASLAILPQTAHPIETVDTDLLAFHIKRFIGT